MASSRQSTRNVVAQRCLALVLLLGSSATVQVRAQSGDGGGAEGVEPGDIGSDPSDSGAAGGEGADVGSVNLSRGATIAIAVVVSVVVVLGSEFSCLCRTRPEH